MKILNNDMYLLLIDEEAEININDYWIYLTSNEDFDGVVTKSNLTEKDWYSKLHDRKSYKKVIAYYPLTKEAKELDLPLLPVTPRNEWGVHEKHCCSKHGCKYGNNNCCVELGITKQRYPCEDCNDEDQKFSLEDMKKALSEAFKASQEGYQITADEIIQSLSTQQLPKEFIPEYENKCWCLKPVNGGCYECTKMLKTITNSEGKEVLCGTYKY